MTLNRRQTRSVGRSAAGPVNWAGRYLTRDGTRYRVWSCAGHLADGQDWLERPGRRTGPSTYSDTAATPRPRPDMRDRTDLAAPDQPQLPGRGQRGISVTTRVSFWLRTCCQRFTSCRRRPASPPTPRSPPRHQPHAPQQLVRLRPWGVPVAELSKAGVGKSRLRVVCRDHGPDPVTVRDPLAGAGWVDTATAARAVLGVSVARLLEHTARAEGDGVAVMAG